MEITEKYPNLMDNQFVLPVGYRDAEGTLHRVVTIKMMDGNVEEAMNDPKVKENGGKTSEEFSKKVGAASGHKIHVL
jgi:hypothetical protein